MSNAKNVLGTTLQTCSTDPMTGFYRDGCCTTGSNDLGRHVICSEVTPAFLRYTKKQGNDLSTPMPQYDFPGLKPGDRWCLCASRWQEAFETGVAPSVVLESTHAKALEIVNLEDLKKHQAIAP
ncbi:MAG: DUF2237 domain-containing protein [Limnothrix sp.]